VYIYGLAKHMYFALVFLTVTVYLKDIGNFFNDVSYLQQRSWHDWGSNPLPISQQTNAILNLAIEPCWSTSV